MSETKDSDANKTGGSGRKPLSLQRTVESGHVRQNFSHGRSKSVVVEKRKSRKLAQPGAAGEDKPAAGTRTNPGRGGNKKPAPGGKNLSDSERDARLRALSAAKEAEAQRQVEQEKAAKAAAEASKKAAEEAAAKPPAPSADAAPPAKAKTVEDKAAPKAAEAPAQPDAAAKPAPKSTTSKPAAAAAPKTTAKDKPAEKPGPSGAADKSAAAPKTDGGDAKAARSEGPAKQGRQKRSLDTAFRPREGGRPKEIILPGASPAIVPPPEAAEEQKPGKIQRAARQAATPAPAEDAPGRGKDKRGKSSRAPSRGGEERQRGKLTVDQLLNREQRERSMASLKRKREREKMKAMGVSQPREKIIREVIIPEVITIQELANRMTERGVDVIKFLMKQGEMHKITDAIDADTAELLVTEFGHTPKRVSESDVEEGFIEQIEDGGETEPRAPVVTIMGHVDHGKTSLLDALRKANVVSGEAGGITQHIGAYQVENEAGNKITFIDTPGHAAFTAMRARGAKVTDIVILVVAADDGVMPQTVEAIAHAKAAEVPMIVAINKIDKPNADPSRVRTELLQHEVIVESMSGDTLEVEVSALKQMNLDKLLDAIALQSELLELRANPDRRADGIVIEAKLERGRGPVGTMLVQRGTLSVGDIIVAGSAWGRVRALINDHGKNVAKAGPSVPVEVLGFDSAPEAGDQFAVVENEARAREITDYRERKRREKLGTAGTPRTLEQMMQSLKDDADLKELHVLVKGDVQGSVEAINGALKKLGTDEVQARLVHTGVGGITESDVVLANASNAVIVGFNVRANVQAKQAAEAQGVEIRYYNIIYDLVDDIKAAMSGLLEPTIRENFLGNAEVLQVFNITKVGKVAGCRVTEGKVERGAKVRLIRDSVVIHEGTLSMLKRFKDDAKEVPAGQECGMSFANYQDLREGDVIECFQVEEIARTLE
ncbi:MAG: translation initiation factor IF-2 [Alphaproteobacteria bacterium]|nr:translation initiation factor IF-2 [Alphaproteobacteria bacterium]